MIDIGVSVSGSLNFPQGKDIAGAIRMARAMANDALLRAWLPTSRVVAAARSCAWVRSITPSSCRVEIARRSSADSFGLCAALKPFLAFGLAPMMSV